MNGRLYWSEYSNWYNIYRISRMQVDGSQYEVLFHEIHRGLAVYNDRLYFMCESGCSLPSWTLVSMPLDGGTPVPEFPLWDGPVQMIQKDGIFYVADTPDGGSMSIYAISLDLDKSCELLSGLDYDDIEIRVSSAGWLYRSQEGGWWLPELKRNRINGCDVGEDQLIDHPIPWAAIHSDDGIAFYYWHSDIGLKVLYESPACPHYGDCNLDDDLTPGDALVAFQHYLGIADPPLNDCQLDQAEVTLDGDITPADALCIFQKHLGIPSCLDGRPECPWD